MVYLRQPCITEYVAKEVWMKHSSMPECNEITLQGNAEGMCVPRNKLLYTLVRSQLNLFKFDICAFEKKNKNRHTQNSFQTCRHDCNRNYCKLTFFLKNFLTGARSVRRKLKSNGTVEVTKQEEKGHRHHCNQVKESSFAKIYFIDQKSITKGALVLNSQTSNHPLSRVIYK